MPLQTLVGIAKAQGLCSPSVQRIFYHHCSTGNVAIITAAVIEVLLDQGFDGTTLPAPRGVLTPGLRQKIQRLALDLAGAYGQRGVLCAKGFVTPVQLASQLASTWELGFSSVLLRPEEEAISVTEVDPDFVARSAVSAQLLFRLLQRSQSPEGGFIIPMSEAEGFCMKATQVMFRAFTMPDAAVHAVLHGDGGTDEQGE